MGLANKLADAIMDELDDVIRGYLDEYGGITI